jgi:hypothetical protein
LKPKRNTSEIEISELCVHVSRSSHIFMHIMDAILKKLNRSTVCSCMEGLILIKNIVKPEPCRLNICICFWILPIKVWLQRYAHSTLVRFLKKQGEICPRFLLPVRV